METLPSCRATLTSAPSVPTPRLEIRTMEISAMTKHGDASGDELELIEMRYQQALALGCLVDLFAEGRFDR